MKALTNEELSKCAPSIFAEVPHKKASDRYVFVPTHKLIEDIRQYKM